MKAHIYLQKRKEALQRLQKIFDNSEYVIVIHYSCESFYDAKKFNNQRITSIAVRNLKSGYTESFSIHQMAELKKTPYDKIEEEYNALEKEMLERFFNFYNQNKNSEWLHWNMRDINYGFPALRHRLETLGGNPTEFNQSKLIDLSRILIDRYGRDYIAHPRLENLIEKNKISKLNFLSGAQEAKAFENKEFIKLHQSTLKKVDILANIAGRAAYNELKSNFSMGRHFLRYPLAMFEYMKEHPAISGSVFLIGIAITIYRFFL